jgi:carboxymethylenebutenolidase
MRLTEDEMVRLWESHTRLEFATKDAEATVATMTPDNYVNHIPVMTGGRGRDEMIEFYGRQFIPKMPADTTLRLLARTVGRDRLIDEFVFSFTHDVDMDWMLPGVPPTHRKVEVANGGRRAVRGGQDRLRADLLGSGVGPGPTRAA